MVASLLHFKWMKFGLIGYIANLLTYVVFLCFLTAFALVVPNPQSPACELVGTNIYTVYIIGASAASPYLVNPTSTLSVSTASYYFAIFKSLIQLHLGLYLYLASQLSS